MGIVFLPGAITGVILAGADQPQTVRLQIFAVFMLAAMSLTAPIVSRPPPGACSRSSCSGWRTARSTEGSGHSEPVGANAGPWSQVYHRDGEALRLAARARPYAPRQSGGRRVLLW